MYDTHIHNGLEDEAMRNGIADGLTQSITSRLTIEPTPYPHDGSIVDRLLHSIQTHKDDIKVREFAIKQLENQIALHTLLEYKGWKEYDVSDEVRTNEKYCRNFIGTEEEYNNLMIKLKEED